MPCSPFKNRLLNVTKRRRGKVLSKLKEKLYDGPTVGRPSCSKRKKKDKENIFFQGVMSNMNSQLRKAGYSA